VQVGDPARLVAATGWQPQIAIEQTLRELLEDWRTRVRASPGA
jgi:GDP-4-dehydro-6-deoxy-D-mannose reductase